MLASSLCLLTLLLVSTLIHVPYAIATVPPTNCLPTGPFNVSLGSNFQLESNLFFSPHSCSLIVLTPPYTVLALSSTTGQPLYHWKFPVDLKYSYPSEGFHLSSTNDRLYTLTYSTDPAYETACTNVVAMSTISGSTVWVRSICVTPAVDAEPYANGDLLIVSGMAKSTGSGVVDYVVHISSSTSFNRSTGLPVNENYTMAVYSSESGQVLSVLDMGAVSPLAIELLSVRNNTALLLLIAGTDSRYQSELIYSLDATGRLSLIRNLSADTDSTWEMRYLSSTLVYTPQDCFESCVYYGVDVVSGAVQWKVRDARLDGFAGWFGDTLPGYDDHNGAWWWPDPRDTSVRFLSSTLVGVTNQATKQQTNNRTLLVAQHAVYNLSTGNYTALSDVLGPVEGELGDKYPGIDLQLTSNGQPILVLDNEYFILDAVTLNVVEQGRMPGEFDGLKFMAWEEWRGQNDSWIWSISIEAGPQWIAATPLKRNATVDASTAAVLAEQ